MTPPTTTRRVSIFGLGYVGVVSAAALAEAGHTIVGVDMNLTKVEMINAGRSPIIEPGLNDMLRRVLAAGRISAFVEPNDRLDVCDVAIVCVGTPCAPDGAHDMRFVAEVSRQIADHLTQGRKAPRAQPRRAGHSDNPHARGRRFRFGRPCRGRRRTRAHWNRCPARSMH